MGQAGHGHADGGRRTPRRSAVPLTAVVVAGSLALAGCTVGSESKTPVERPTTTRPGGVLTLLSVDPIATWDPQQISDPSAAALSSRLLHRTLTAYAPGPVQSRSDGTAPDTLVGDLATDTGHASPDLKSWTFTLREDIRWQDGSTITCADVRHGVARTFATTSVKGGALDALAVLAIPKSLDGTPTYAGPWATGPETEAGRTAFEAAITCDQRKITFHLAVPVSDFNEVVTQAAFAPIKASLDTTAPAQPGAPAGAGANTAATPSPPSGAAVTPGGSVILASNGPYVLQGDWDPAIGGTFVRNPNWSGATDSLRKAYPDKIVIRTGVPLADLVNAVIHDGPDAINAVALTPAPLALRQQIAALPSLQARALVAETEVVDYLALNVTSPTLSRTEVRRALALATNRSGYAVSLGGGDTARPAGSVIPSTLAARRDTPAPVAAADPAAARKLLQAAGITAPVPVKVAYRPGPAQDKAMAALVASWQEAGFAPVLVPIKDNYYSVISAPAAATSYDVLWTSWAPTWGSASTILPALFDSDLNLTSAGSGRDVGLWKDAEWNAGLSTIATIVDPPQREKAWAAADRQLLEAGAYVALAERQAVHLAGSGVRNLVTQRHSGGTPDLALLGVDH